jgi:hypothetical protein
MVDFPIVVFNCAFDYIPSATPDIIHQAAFCLEVTAKVLPLYEKIFDIEYPLPKLDTLAVSLRFVNHT